MFALRQDTVGAQPVQASGGAHDAVRHTRGAADAAGRQGGRAPLQPPGPHPRHVRTHALRLLEEAERTYERMDSCKTEIATIFHVDNLLLA